MNVEPLLKSAPVLLIDEFLDQQEAAECLEECITLKPFFRDASVGQGSHNRVDPRVRRNDVVMLDTLFQGVRDHSKILRSVDRKVRSAECNRLWHNGYSIFDIINYAPYSESVLSRYGTCDFYGRHQDTKFHPEDKDQIRHRLVTLVYYVNREPESFTGGNLTLYPDLESPVTVAPRHNRAVVFPSFMFHSVAKVRLDDDAHENGRFSLNHWIGFR